MCAIATGKASVQRSMMCEILFAIGGRLPQPARSLLAVQTTRMCIIAIHVRQLNLSSVQSRPRRALPRELTERRASYIAKSDDVTKDYVALSGIIGALDGSRYVSYVRGLLTSRRSYQSFSQKPVGAS